MSIGGIFSLLLNPLNIKYRKGFNRKFKILFIIKYNLSKISILNSHCLPLFLLLHNFLQFYKLFFQLKIVNVQLINFLYMKTCLKCEIITSHNPIEKQTWFFSAAIKPIINQRPHKILVFTNEIIDFLVFQAHKNIFANAFLKSFAIEHVHGQVTTKLRHTNVCILKWKKSKNKKTSSTYVCELSRNILSF